MKKKILVLMFLCLALFVLGVGIVYASTEILVPNFTVSCSTTGQTCDPPHNFSFTTATGGQIQAQYDVPSHCSSIRIHFYLDGNMVSTSGWLGWPGAPSPYNTLPLTTGLVDLGVVGSGTHVVGFKAEGQNGGCNGGRLYSWGGSGEVVITVQPVDIDIKPGSYPNCFNSDGHGVIPVAILGSAEFDASNIDPFSVSLDGAAVRVKGKSGNAGSLEDVNGDDFLDLVVQIVDDNVYIGETTAFLSGNTYDGVPIIGSDSICLRPPEQVCNNVKPTLPLN